jgi:hypothetical protein
MGLSLSLLEIVSTTNLNIGLMSISISFRGMKKLITLIAFLMSCTQLMAQKPEQKYRMIKGANAVQYKNYYLLTLFQKVPQVKEMLEEDDVLNSLLKTKLEKAAEALKNCDNEIPCYSGTLMMSSGEIALVSRWLAEHYTTNNAFGNLVREHLIPSGCYIMYADAEPKTILVKAWEQDAAALNYAIGVYVDGKKPNYPRIDSLSFEVKSKSYPAIVSANIYVILREDNKLFFEPTMAFALQAMELDGRLNASDYEPMEFTVNKPALEKVKEIDWSKYKYSIILVPGAGPDDKETEISAGGMLRCRLAAQQFRKGMAPFIVLSGGRVHPYKTKYSEAYEMKKFMMNTLMIPESAIIMDPHARHTTTNMRNASRLIFRYGMPMEKPAITSTLKSQSSYISNTVADRSKKELGYYPYKNGNRLSETEMEFYPLVGSLQIDFDEPMDP